MSEQTPQAKPWYKSKTIIVSILVQVLAVLEMATEGDVLPKEWMPAVLFITGAVQAGLRFATNGPVTAKPPKKEDVLP